MGDRGDRMRWARSFIVAAGLSVLHFGCSDDEPTTAERVGEETSELLGVDVTEADCPDDADLSSGAEFDCTVSVGGQRLTVTVLVAAAGELTVEPLGGVFERRDLERLVEAKASELLGLEVAAKCGQDPVVLVERDETVECAVEAADGTTGFAEVAVDDRGEPVVVGVSEG